MLSYGGIRASAQTDTRGLAEFGNQLLQQGREGIEGSATSYHEYSDVDDLRVYRPGDRFGEAVAVADFNGDGYDDVAIGAPQEDSPDPTQGFTMLGGGPGIVNVIYGSADRLSASATIQNHFVKPSDAVAGDKYGQALAAGDFNKDGYADLAAKANGYVHIIYGTPHGLFGRQSRFPDLVKSLVVGDFNGDGADDLAIGTFQGARIIYGEQATGLDVNNGRTGGEQVVGQGLCDPSSQGGRCFKGTSDLDDAAGFSTAAGDFNNDGFDDLAIGLPRENGGRGSVHVVYGGFFGLLARNGPGDQIWTQNSCDPQSLNGHCMEGGEEARDRFGYSLAAGDFDGNGTDDLAIGIPGEDDDEGAVAVIYGAPEVSGDERNGLMAGFGLGNQLWHQNSCDPADAGGACIAGGSEGDNDVSIFQEGDQFGHSLTAGDFDKNGVDDLAIGVPGEDFGFEDPFGPGAVAVIYGQRVGLRASGNQLWTQDSPGIEGAEEANYDLSKDGRVDGTADTFGWALAAGDFDGDGKADLAIGVPGEDDDAGAVAVLYGGNDKTPPTIEPVITNLVGGIPSVSNDGWYHNTPVLLGWEVKDDQSSVITDGCSQITVQDTGGRFIKCTATSAGGSATKSVFIKQDTTPPAISVKFSPSIIFLNQPAAAIPTATDTTSGVASVSCPPVDTRIFGARTMTCTATDKAGNTARKNVSYYVNISTSISGVNTASSKEGVATASWGNGGLGVGTPDSVSVVAVGEGTATVAGYTQNPGPAQGFTSSNAFSFVNLEDGHSFREITITNCRLGGSSLAYWGRGSSWQLVSDQTYDRAKGCLTIKVNDTTSPSISDLTGGAVFGIKNTEDQILELMALVNSFNLKKPSAAKFDHGLGKALAASRGSDTRGTCKELEWFIKKVNQEARKKITDEEAGQLLNHANRIRNLLACP